MKKLQCEFGLRSTIFSSSKLFEHELSPVQNVPESSPLRPATKRPCIILQGMMEMQNDQLKQMSQQVCSALDGVVILLVIILLVVHLR